ncbi:hypothetical protein NHF50_10615 [Flavobacterium sp. NRK F10]|uniref:hypothetical protein n=1 Tax=Flavobacterium sp. NRK F10 TaxID=2954931 RepID=UPI0020916EF7|nr:hypothetical protein [Flavobacterium sp. NRK F10]MCO6175496.1 hypothetical protein [Flavobacterium sp. NRK F10]
MKKLINNNFRFALPLFSLLALASCDDNMDEPGYPALADKPVVTVTYDNLDILELDNETTVGVNENLATFVLTADRIYKEDMKFSIKLNAAESTADANDFTISLSEADLDYGTDGAFVATIPANTLSTTFTVAANFDIYPESTENLVFDIKPMADLNGTVAGSSQKIELTIGNSISDELVLILDWNGDRTYTNITDPNDPYESTLADYDFDLEVYNSGFSLVDYSWSDSPERVNFATSNADGLYFVVAGFYSTYGAVPMLPINFDVTLTIAKPGVFVYDYDMSGIWNSTDGGDDEGNADAYQVPVYFVKTTTNGVATYEVYNLADDTLLASGKSSTDLKVYFNSFKRVK